MGSKKDGKSSQYDDEEESDSESSDSTPKEIKDF